MLFTYGNAKKQIERGVTESLLALTASKENHTEMFIHERKKDVTVLSRMPSIVEAMEKFDVAFKVGHQLYSIEYMTIEQELRPFLKGFQDLSGYTDLLLISQEGNVIFSVNRGVELGTNLLHGPFHDSSLAGIFDRARTLMETELSDFARHPETNQPTAFIAAPVFKFGRLLGVVALAVAENEIFKIFQDYAGLGETGEIVVASRKGNQAMIVAPLRHEKDAALKKKIILGSPLGLPIQNAIRGNKGSSLSVDYRGKQVLAVWSYLPSYHWGMVVKIDAEEAFSPIFQLKNATLLTGALLLGIVIFGAFYVGRSISNPLVNLARRTTGFRQNNFIQPIEESGPSEVRFLARALNSMGEELKQTYSTLKNKLDELSKLNEDLGREMNERQKTEETLRLKENQIQHIQKMESIGTLAGGIAHDFNNILAAILGFAELGLGKLQKESQQYNYLQEIMRAGGRAKSLVQQILTFSRQGENRRELISLNLVINEVVRLLRATLPSTIEIQVGVSVGSEQIIGDPTQMHQILMNLCTNAEHAMRKTGGVLEIRLENFEATEGFVARYPELSLGPKLKLTIRDTGHGIPENVLPRIFDPFFTTKVVGEGTGMGLAVVHGIVISHGGAILVESAPGKGTTFSLYFPQIQCSGEEGNPEEALETMAGAGRILFVDDEEPLARLGKEMLEELGYEAVIYTNSVEALEVFRAEPDKFDAVITDQTMPKMVGEQLAAEMLQIRPDLPVILCTGFSHTISPESAKAIGIRAYLMKPVVTKELATILFKELSPH